MRIIQIVESLDYGDGVSNDVINIRAFLDEIGLENTIYARWINERVSAFARPFNKYVPNSKDIVLFHFSAYSTLLEEMKKTKIDLIMRYHNITPPKFFLPDNPDTALSCEKGLSQLKDNINIFEEFWTDSKYNAECLEKLGAKKDKLLVLPIAYDYNELQSAEYDEALLTELSKNTNLLFIGRIAPNKKIEDVLSIFDKYNRMYNKDSKLYLIGNNQQSIQYFNKLTSYVANLPSKEKICFLGKVDKVVLYTYLKSASVFLCMSEHEGFCIPILEAQSMGVPVVGCNLSAVPDTMGNSGIIINEKNFAITARLIDVLMNDKQMKKQIIDKQYDNLKRFNKTTVISTLKKYLFMRIKNKYI